MYNNYQTEHTSRRRLFLLHQVVFHVKVAEEREKEEVLWQRDEQRHLGVAADGVEERVHLYAEPHEELHLKPPQ